MTWLAIAVAGAAGAVCRHLLDLAVSGWRPGRPPSAFPWGTAAVNLSGAALLGCLTGLAVDAADAPAWLVVAGTGFCGAYTTFSTWMVETVRLAEARAWGQAAGNLATLLLGVVAAAAGWWLGTLLASAGG